MAFGDLAMTTWQRRHLSGHSCGCLSVLQGEVGALGPGAETFGWASRDELAALSPPQDGSEDRQPHVKAALLSSETDMCVCLSVCVCVCLDSVCVRVYTPYKE